MPEVDLPAKVLVSAIDQLSRYGDDQLGAILKGMAQVEADLLGRLSTTKGPGTREWLAGMVDEARSAYLTISAEVSARETGLRTTAQDAMAAAYTELGDEVSVSFTRPAEGSLLAALEVDPVGKGGTIGELFKHLDANLAAPVINRLRAGYASGETVDQMIRALRGTRATGYTDGIMAGPRYAIERYVRTFVMHVSNEANMSWLNGIPEAERIQFVATLDSATCPVCGPLDGKEYAKDDQAKPRPPMHPNCRCLYVPVLPDWFPRTGKEKRASADGLRPSSTTWTSLKRRGSGVLKKRPDPVKPKAKPKAKPAPAKKTAAKPPKQRPSASAGPKPTKAPPKAPKAAKGQFKGNPAARPGTAEYYYGKEGLPPEMKADTFVDGGKDFYDKRVSSWRRIKALEAPKAIGELQKRIQDEVGALKLRRGFELPRDEDMERLPRGLIDRMLYAIDGMGLKFGASAEGSHYNPAFHSINFSSSREVAAGTIIHELGHAADILNRSLFAGPGTPYRAELRAALLRDVDGVLDRAIAAGVAKKVETGPGGFGYNILDNNVSDIIQGMTVVYKMTGAKMRDLYGAGHGTAYWGNHPDMLALEAVADISSGVATGYRIALERIFPNTVKAWEGYW